MTCWLYSSEREKDYLMAGPFLNLPQIDEDRGKITDLLESMFYTMYSDFLSPLILYVALFAPKKRNIASY
jgi:hypothetical protein